MIQTAIPYCTPHRLSTVHALPIRQACSSVQLCVQLCLGAQPQPCALGGWAWMSTSYIPPLSAVQKGALDGVWKGKEDRLVPSHLLADAPRRFQMPMSSHIPGIARVCLLFTCLGPAPGDPLLQESEAAAVAESPPLPNRLPQSCDPFLHQ